MGIVRERNAVVWFSERDTHWKTSLRQTYKGETRKLVRRCDIQSVAWNFMISKKGWLPQDWWRLPVHQEGEEWLSDPQSAEKPNFSVEQDVLHTLPTSSQSANGLRCTANTASGNAASQWWKKNRSRSRCGWCERPVRSQRRYSRDTLQKESVSGLWVSWTTSTPSTLLVARWCKDKADLCHSSSGVFSPSNCR